MSVQSHPNVVLMDGDDAVRGDIGCDDRPLFVEPCAAASTASGPAGTGGEV